MAWVDGVLFDFGGVFFDSPFAAVHDFGAAGGIGGPRLVEYVFGRYDEDTDHPWHRLERGEIDLLAARDQIQALAAAEGHDVDLFQALSGLTGATVRDGMIAVARDARAAGCRVGLVTNNVREFGDGWRRMLPVDELFDVVIDSHQVGMRKPDPRIFRMALEGLGGVAPERAVFLDDFAGNVAAARALGMQGIVVGPDWEQAVAELRALLA